MTDSVRAAISGSTSLRSPEPVPVSAHTGDDPGREPIRCDGCGRFIGYDDLERSQFEFTPLNEFGPEESSWLCPRCITKGL